MKKPAPTVPPAPGVAGALKRKPARPLRGADH